MLKQFQIIWLFIFLLKERYHESDLRLSKIVFQRNDDEIKKYVKKLTSLLGNEDPSGEDNVENW